MDQLAVQEQDKYRRMWAHPNYGVASPGLQIVQQFLNITRPLAGASITDYGAGDCKAARYLAEKGFKLQVVDIALEAACKSDSTRFVIGAFEQCLWSMRNVIETDYALCTDVMEHIPGEKVDSVLRAIWKRTRIEAVFTIFHHPDGCGKLIGERLHLTVQPPAWWLGKLARHFSNVTTQSVSDVATLYHCRK